MRTSEQLQSDFSALLRFAEWRKIEPEEFISILTYTAAKTISSAVQGGIITREDAVRLVDDLRDEICGVIEGDARTEGNGTRH